MRFVHGAPQHKLVTQKFGIEKIKLVTGWSMGAAQTFRWGTSYPDMVERICPFQGAAKCSRHNFDFLEGVKAALTADTAFNYGWYDKPPMRGLRAMARVYAGWGFSQTFYRQQLDIKALGYSSLEDFLVSFWEGFFLPKDANDLLAPLWTWQNADISANDKYSGNFKKALRKLASDERSGCPSTVRKAKPSPLRFRLCTRSFKTRLVGGGVESSVSRTELASEIAWVTITRERWSIKKLRATPYVTTASARLATSAVRLKNNVTRVRRRSECFRRATGTVCPIGRRSAATGRRERCSGGDDDERNCLLFALQNGSERVEVGKHQLAPEHQFAADEHQSLATRGADAGDVAQRGKADFGEEGDTCEVDHQTI